MGMKRGSNEVHQLFGEPVWNIKRDQNKVARSPTEVRMTEKYIFQSRPDGRRPKVRTNERRLNNIEQCRCSERNVGVL